MDDVLGSILDTHPDYIARFDSDLRFTYANKALADFFKETKSDLIGKSLFSFLSEEATERTIERLKALRPDAPLSTSVQETSMEDGTAYILWTNIGLYDGDRMIGLQSVGRNVTKRHQLEQEIKQKSAALERTQDELRAVLDAVPALIWYKDDKNNILRLNKAAAESMNMRVEDVEGQNTYDLFGEAAKAYHEDDLRVFESGEALRGHIEPFTPDDGEQGWVQTDKILLKDGPDGPRLLVVATDISELKKKEAILKSINKNLDDFASMASHDLQAPLRKIGITAELMQLELGDKLPAEANSYFKDIDQGVDHMRGLIRSFLRFMRASPDGITLDTVNLQTIVNQVIQGRAKELEALGASIGLPAEAAYVRGDVALLRQVFENLISNAIKYRSEKRPLSIDIDVCRDNQFWAITVQDNGVGVDPHFEDQIFDLFGRAKPETTIKGSGIGLALCRRIITLHGGTIRFIRNNTPGSCFELKLYCGRVPSHE